MAGINELIAHLQSLPGAEVVRRVGAKIANAAHAECVRGFVEQRDPYGQRWAPRKQPTGAWPLLDKTGAGLNGLTARCIGRLVVVRIRGYFRFHQNGTRYMAARKIFPEPGRGLGSWSEPINAAARDAVSELMTATQLASAR